MQKLGSKYDDSINLANTKPAQSKSGQLAAQLTWTMDLIDGLGFGINEG